MFPVKVEVIRVSDNSFVIPKGTVIMCSEPFPEKTIDEMRAIAENAKNESDIADAFAIAENKAWWIEDDMYDFEVGSEEYKKVREVTDAWFSVADQIRNKIFAILKSEGITDPENGGITVLKPFMKRNGYYDGNGWWVKG